LIRSVEMQKILDEVQNILIKRRPNAKDFDRGCRNTKYFAFVTYISKIILHSRRADTKSLGLCALS
jgi:hypothetical protein